MEHLKWHFGQKGNHYSLNQLAHSSQNPLTFPITLIMFSLARLTNLGMTCQQWTLTQHIQIKLIQDKHFYFEFCKVSVEEVKKGLSINNNKPPGSDNLDVKLLIIIADNIATPICHIFNLSLLESVCPQAWRKAKVIPLPKYSKAPFTVSNSWPISLLPTLTKLLETIVFNQLQCYFTVNKLTTDFQHAYRERHSTSTALTQMTDNWLKKYSGSCFVRIQCGF